MAEDKQYQSLYRRYRPQGPQEVLGQEHVVRALMGAVREGRLAHAFLFTGPRGTGKTSTARILAKMVNCERGPTPEPCGSCEQCVRIREGQHLDVVEIDAASHGGVDDARELRERAPTAPAAGREKVYIIDEAQRLSREAFDALLKVFEEPPTGVRFVLATTEPHKMPATIIGRCQRFDFRRVPADVVAGHLRAVAKEEGMTLPDGVAHAIARQAEGSVRDALSLLDQTAVLGGDEVSAEALASLLGKPRGEVQDALADAVAVGDTRSVFSIVHGLVEGGQDLRHVTAETLAHFRNVLIAKSAPGQTDLLDVTEEDYARLRAQAAKFQPAELSRIIALLLAAQTDMRWTTSPRISLELALVRATIPETDPNPEGLIARIERLERLAGVEPGKSAPKPAGAKKAETAPAPEPPEKAETAPAPEPPEKAETPPAESPPAESPPAEPPSAEPPPAETPAAEPAEEPVPAAAAVSGDGPAAVDVEMLRRSWPALIEHLQSHRQPILKALLESATPVSFDGSTLELAFPPDRNFGVTKVEAKAADLQAALGTLFGVEPSIRCVVRESVAGPVEPEDDEPPASETEALARLRSELDAKVAPEGEDA